MKLRLIYILVTLVFYVSAKAQETLPLTLSDAVNYALENQVEAKKAELQTENSEYLIQEARAGALPQISGYGSLTYNPILQKTAIPAGDFPGGEQFPDPFIVLAMGQKWNSAAGVNINQNLFNQTVFTGLKAAKTTREFYQINSQLTEEQIIEKVAIAYFNVYVQKSQLETIDSSYVNVSKSKDIIQSLFENGLAREIDLDRVQVQLANLSSVRQQLVNAVELQENTLKFFMGMPMSQSIELADEDFEINYYLLENEIDVENRTELKLMGKQFELLQLQKEARKAEYYPSLSLSASYNYMGQGNRFPIGAGLKNGVYWSDFAYVGLNLNIPIFSGMVNKARVNQADIELRTLDEEIKYTKLAMDFEYQNAKTQINNILIEIDSQRENVKLAEKVVRNTENNYQLGLTGLTELLEAENALVDAKNNYSNAILQYKLAEIQLLKAKGELSTLK